jgi:putative aldouronate transport system permease protein
VVKDTSISSKLLDFFVYSSLIIILAVTLLPILNVMSISLSSSKAVFFNEVTFYPKGLNLEAYKNIFGGKTVPRAFMNSIVYSTVGTFLSVTLNALVAYPMSKKYLPLKKLYWAIFIIPMYISGGLIPTFILIKSLRLYDTMWALVLPVALGTGAIIVMRTFFMGLPQELEEAARIDGASNMMIFLRIILPLSKPILATMGLFTFVGHWNNYFGPLIYLHTQRKNPIQVVLQQIIMQEQFTQDLMKQGVTGADVLQNVNRPGSEYDSVVWIDRIKYATLFSAMLPIILLYPFLQKYFAKGVIIGSLKG